METEDTPPPLGAKRNSSGEEGGGLEVLHATNKSEFDNKVGTSNSLMKPASPVKTTVLEEGTEEGGGKGMGDTNQVETKPFDVSMENDESVLQSMKAIVEVATNQVGTKPSDNSMESEEKAMESITGTSMKTAGLLLTQVAAMQAEDLRDTSVLQTVVGGGIVLEDFQSRGGLEGHTLKAPTQLAALPTELVGNVNITSTVEREEEIPTSKVVTAGSSERGGHAEGFVQKDEVLDVHIGAADTSLPVNYVTKPLVEGAATVDEAAETSKEVQIENVVKLQQKDFSGETNLKNTDDLVGSCSPTRSFQEIGKENYVSLQSEEFGRLALSQKRLGVLSNGVAEAVAAGVAEGVAEGIAESLVETIANETGGGLAQGITLEGDSTGKAGAIDIVKTVAEVIAEAVAHEVAQGVVDGLAEAAAIAEETAVLDDQYLDGSPEANAAGGNTDGVLCDCGKVAVVRMMGQKSPNRGLRYLMCAAQEPSFFKRKGKRKGSDTQNCRFFQWVDVPRPVKEDRSEGERGKLHQKDLILQQQGTPYSTRSAGKRGHQDTPDTAVPSTLEAHDMPLSASPTLEDPEASQILPGLAEADAEKVNKQVGEGKVDADLNQGISLVGATSTLSANMEEKNKEGHQISSTKATEMDHRSRVPTRGQTGDSSPSVALMEDQGSQHATRSAVNKGLTSGKAEQSLILTHKVALDTSGLVASLEAEATQEPLTAAPKIMPSNAEISGSLNAIKVSSLSNLTDTADRHYTRSAAKKGTVEIGVDQGIFPSNAAHSVLGKQAADSPEVPTGVMSPKLGQVRRQRSFRSEVHQSTVIPLGDVAVKRSPAVGFSEKKDHHYTRRSSTRQENSSAERNQKLSGSQENEQDDNNVMATARGNRIEMEQQSRVIHKGSTGDVPAKTRPKKTLASQIDEESPKEELARRKQSQSRRHQQRELPLSEVYGTVEPLSSTKVSAKGGKAVGNTEAQNAALQKSSPPSVLIKNELGEQLKSSSKKRKQLQECLLLEEFSPDSNSFGQSTAKKSKISIEPKEYLAELGDLGSPWTSGHSGTEARLMARYAAKLPAEEYHGPDDPWSLDAPWVEKKVAKQPGQSSMTPEISFGSESCKDTKGKEKIIEQATEIPETHTAQDVRMWPTEIAETPSVLDSQNQLNPVVTRVQIEDLVKEVSDASVPAGGKDTCIKGPVERQEPSMSEKGDQLVKDVETGFIMKDTEDVSRELPEHAVDDSGVKVVETSPVAEAHKEDRLRVVAAGPPSSDSVLTMSRVTVLEDVKLGVSAEDSIKNHCSGLCGSRGDEPGTENIQMVENIADLAQEDRKKGGEDVGSVLPVVGSEVPGIEKGVMEAKSTTVVTVIYDPTMAAGCIGLDEVVCGPAEGLRGNEPTANAISENTLMVETAEHTASGRTDFGAVEVGKLCMNTNVTAEEKLNEDTSMVESSEVALTEEKSGLPDLDSDTPVLQDAVPIVAHRTEFPIYVTQGLADKKRGWTGSEEEHSAPGKTRRKLVSVRIPAASETTGFVSSVWRLASGRKTRSVGSIGAPVVMSKRARSVMAPVHKHRGNAVDSEGNSRTPAEAQWVDVPLDWRNEKSCGKMKHVTVTCDTTALKITGPYCLQPGDGTGAGARGIPSRVAHGQDEHKRTARGKGHGWSTATLVRDEESAGEGSELEETTVVLKMKSYLEIVENTGSGTSSQNVLNPRDGQELKTALNRSIPSSDVDMEPKEAMEFGRKDGDTRDVQVQDTKKDVDKKDGWQGHMEIEQAGDINGGTDVSGAMDLKVKDSIEVHAKFKFKPEAASINMNNSLLESSGSKGVVHAHPLLKEVASSLGGCSKDDLHPGKQKHEDIVEVEDSLDRKQEDQKTETKKVAKRGRSRKVPNKVYLKEQSAHQVGNGSKEHTNGTVNKTSSPSKITFTAVDCELSQSVEVADASPPEEEMRKHEHRIHVEKAKKADDKAEANEPTTEAVKEGGQRNVHWDDNGAQLESSAWKLEKGSVTADTMNVTEADQGKIQSEGEVAEEKVGAPLCNCKLSQRRAVMKTVTRTGDANMGLRYWSCSNYRVPFIKKRKEPNEVEEESCKFFRWLDTPRLTAIEEKERRKERYRQVELQRLL